MNIDSKKLRLEAHEVFAQHTLMDCTIAVTSKLSMRMTTTKAMPVSSCRNISSTPFYPSGSNAPHPRLWSTLPSITGWHERAQHATSGRHYFGQSLCNVLLRGG